MAPHYDLTVGDDRALYASLPGTTGTGFIPHNMTPMKSNLAPGREVAGCHPSRWVHELLNNNFTVCDLFDRARQLDPSGTQPWEHTHRLVINGNQSFATSSTRILSAVCLDCHFHFVFKMQWDEDHTSSLCDPKTAEWPLHDNVFPWHHMVWVGSGSDVDITRDHTKYYPLLARENFVCSAPPCTFQLTLEISQPRMKQWWIELLVDHDEIKQQLDAARAADPKRYEQATNEWVKQAPLNLNTYLKNQLESTPETARSISKRNKRFAALFGPRCFSLFRDLEFEEEVDINDDIDEGSFTPTPAPAADGPSGTTELNTYRSFIEDVRSEIQCLIHRAGFPDQGATYCIPLLHADLQCQEVTGLGLNALVNVDRYKLLGVLPTQSREIVVNAYKRQWELMPSKRRDLIEALMGVANDSRDEPLSDYAITQSSVFDSQPHQQATGDDDGIVTQSLVFLGLNPPNNYTANAIIDAFRKKLAESPAEASTARNVLMLIAQGSTDDMYQATLLMETDPKMSLDTARAVLGLDKAHDNGPVAIEAARSKLAAGKGKEENEIYLDALDAIAEHTASPTVKQAVMEMRHTYSTYGSSSLHDSDNQLAVDLMLPVGLNNIGNTCYLNSLLQYLFTIQPVRDVVLNYDKYALGLSDENIQRRRIGGNKMQMDRGEAVVAHAFAEELAELFKNLKTSDKTATRPSQRLANAVLLSTHTLLNSDKSKTETAKAVDNIPRALNLSNLTPPSPSKPTFDIDMITPAKHVESDTISISSTQTLVDMEDSDITDKPGKPPIVIDDAWQAIGVTDIAKSSDDDIMKDMSHQHETATEAVVDLSSQPITQPKEAADIDMVDAEIIPESVDQKVLNALEHQKRSSGTDQQDVEEVMGSILNRLQAAIRPSDIDKETGIQLEKIMQTFFVTTVNYTKKFDEKKYQSEISFDRAITAFPAADGPCSLYDALARNFDQQILEDSKLSRYTAIKTLPPILHILIQRSQSMGSKNGNPVVIPETLYLDRYMDTEHNSPAFRRRVEGWVTTDRIQDLKTQLAKVENNPPTYMRLLESRGHQMSVMDPTPAENGNVDDGVDVASSLIENWDFDGPVDDDFMLIAPSKTTTIPSTEPLAPPLEGVQETHEDLKSMMAQELRKHEEILENQHAESTEVPYRLHAVICHRGHLTSGHYWVWIHDFEDNVWRWYNDADVKENKNTEEVLKTLSTGGEPYYLCYVKDGVQDNFVSVPKREVPTPPLVASLPDDAMPLGVSPGEPGAEAVPTNARLDDDGDIVVIGDHDQADMEQSRSLYATAPSGTEPSLLD